jgi:transcriptional regulator with XRE-family HTH domain
MSHVTAYLHFKGYTQRQIADYLGISPGHFSRMCNGEYEFPLSGVKPLAELLRLKAEAIVDGFTTVRDEWIDQQETEIDGRPADELP